MYLELTGKQVAVADPLIDHPTGLGHHARESQG